MFHNGIQIGDKGRCYRFLGCSNSQLRSAGAWFVSESGSVSESGIKCTGKVHIIYIILLLFFYLINPLSIINLLHSI